jgi:heavy metal translocating P-type ATPase
MASADRAAWWRIGLGAVLAVNSMTVDLAINTSEADPWTRTAIHIGVLVVTVVVFVLLGAPLAAASWREARRRRLTIEAMFVLAIGGSLGASLVAMLRGEGAVYFEVAAILMVVYSLGQQLGRTAQRRAVEASDAWQRELASCQLVEADGRVRAVPVAELQAGQVVEVQPGRLIPADGKVVTGEAFVRETTLTGEHFAVVRRPGDQVWAGTHAVDGLLQVRASSTGTSRRIDAILAAVEHARATPGHLQRQADRFIAIFLPAVASVSVLTGVGWGLARGWSVGLFNAMAVLLVACPCALGLATPLAVWRALGALARRGLVPHAADAVERLAAARTVVLDKTGTITESASFLADLVTHPDAGLSSHELLDLLARVEAGNPHPLAVAFAGRGGGTASTWRPERVRVTPGTGLEAEMVDTRDHRMVLTLGAPARLCAEGEPATTWAALRQRLHPGVRGQEVAVLLDGRVAAVALVAERPRPGWDAVRHAFRDLGLDLVVMSGDPEAARAGLGDVEVLAGLGPEGKLAEVQRRQEAGHPVLFVGDGVNDAAAMAASFVSVAVQEGAELTREVATLSWHGRHLQDLAAAVAESRVAVRTIRSNLRFAAAYNLTGVTLASAGILHPIVAALLMTCSSLVVTWRAAGLGEDGEADASGTPVTLKPVEVTR